MTVRDYLDNDPTYQRLINNQLALSSGLILSFSTLQNTTQINLGSVSNQSLPDQFYLEIVDAIQRDFETKVLSVCLLPSSSTFLDRQDVLLVIHENILETKLEKIRKRCEEAAKLARYSSATQYRGN